MKAQYANLNLYNLSVKAEKSYVKQKICQNIDFLHKIFTEAHNTNDSWNFNNFGFFQLFDGISLTLSDSCEIFVQVYKRE